LFCLKTGVQTRVFDIGCQGCVLKKRQRLSVFPTEWQLPHGRRFFMSTARMVFPDAPAPKATKLHLEQKDCNSHACARTTSLNSEAEVVIAEADSQSNLLSWSVKSYLSSSPFFRISSNLLFRRTTRQQSSSSDRKHVGIHVRQWLFHP